MNARTNWIETVFDGDPVVALKTIMSSKSTGQIVMNVSQGTVCSVVWRERKVEQEPGIQKTLDNHAAP